MLPLFRNLTGNNLSGGLPSNWGLSSIFPSLQILDLSQNPSLSGALPPNWGTQGAFPSLQVLSLSSTGISGQLPAAWGGQLSLPQLVQLDLSDNVLGGSDPATIPFTIASLSLHGARQYLDHERGESSNCGLTAHTILSQLTARESGLHLSLSEGPKLVKLSRR